ncbi:MAG: hypothetical protein PHR47_01485 [Candidatus Pacebacteria bacterium]|nr:hypothetical protein [Candidatus Paceibacterota bacterium]
MNFNIPYRFQLFLPIIIWSAICFIFNITTVLNIVNFESETQNTFLIISFSYFLLIMFGIAAKNIPIFPFSSNEIEILNKNIKNNKLIPNINTNEVSKTLAILSNYSKVYLAEAFYFGIGYLILICAWQSTFLNNYFDIFIIFITGIIAISLLIGFTLFWFQFQSFNVIKECRDFLLSKGLCSIETYFSSIRAKFYFLIFFFIDTLLLYFLSILCRNNNGNIIFLSGLVLIIFITSIMFFYLNKSFNEFFDLAKIVSEEDLSIFSTGSLDKEFVDLSKNLNEISTRLYSSKQEAVRAKKEMEKRVVELEKFFDLTINREEKMIELKKENEDLRKKIEKSNR